MIVSTAIMRADQDGDLVVECEVAVEFVVTHFKPSRPAVRHLRNGDPGWPADPAEYEFDIVSIEFEVGRFSDPQEPMTDAERASITAWFNSDAGYDAAVDAAEGDRDRYYDLSKYVNRETV